MSETPDGAPGGSGPFAEDARRWVSEQGLDEVVRESVESAPRLSEGQRAQLAALFKSARRPSTAA